jgi:hypothetical protein
MATTTITPAFAELLQKAVTEPGTLSVAYSQFHTYSLLCDPQHRRLNVFSRTM